MNKTLFVIILMTTLCSFRAYAQDQEPASKYNLPYKNTYAKEPD